MHCDLLASIAFRVDQSSWAYLSANSTFATFAQSSLFPNRDLSLLIDLGSGFIWKSGVLKYFPSYCIFVIVI